MRTILLYISCCMGFVSFGQQTINASITHGGLQRDYILYVPASYDSTAPVPLLFNFHGYTSNASDQMWYGDFRPIADTAGFIIVHPQGTLDNSNATHFNVGWGGSSVDDVGFTSALIDSIDAQYAINLDRVYSTGMSNGGYMSFHLACNLSDRIAAVGSVTGSMVPFTMNNCNATHMTPVLQIHGTSDGTVPYNGGAGWSAPIQDVLDHWATYNGCALTPVIEDVPNINTGDGTTVERHSYVNLNGCATVKHYKIFGGSHTWAGSIFNSAGTNYDINASVEVWRFVSQFDINGVINNCSSLNIHESTLDLVTYSPNPVIDHVQINGIDNLDLEYELINGLGIICQSGTIAKDNIIDLTGQTDGIYLIRLFANDLNKTGRIVIKK